MENLRDKPYTVLAQQALKGPWVAVSRSFCQEAWKSQLRGGDLAEGVGTSGQVVFLDPPPTDLSILDYSFCHSL